VTSESIFSGLASIAEALRAAQRPFAVVGGQVLSMSDRRPLDRTDAINLILVNPTLDLASVSANVNLIVTRGFDRGEPLVAKLESVLTAAREQQEPKG
jgi:hypothetical protein